MGVLSAVLSVRRSMSPLGTSEGDDEVNVEGFDHALEFICVRRHPHAAELALDDLATVRSTITTVSAYPTKVCWRLPSPCHRAL